MINKTWLGLACVLASAAAHGQEFERNYSKYLRPLIFVLPKPPEPSASNPSRKYVAKVDVLADGTVQLPVSVEPSEPFILLSSVDASEGVGNVDLARV